MRSVIAVFATTVGLAASGCGATARTTTAQAQAVPMLASATATFISQDHGKDADSEVTVQLLRNNAELGAEIRSVGTEFDDHASAGPFAFTLFSPFTTRDIDTGQLRVRLTPDGNDDWTFDLRMTMRFSDGSSRDFLWRDVRLDRSNPERVLTLGPARI